MNLKLYVDDSQWKKKYDAVKKENDKMKRKLESQKQDLKALKEKIKNVEDVNMKLQKVVIDTMEDKQSKSFMIFSNFLI